VDFTTDRTGWNLSPIDVNFNADSGVKFPLPISISIQYQLEHLQKCTGLLLCRVEPQWYQLTGYRYHRAIGCSDWRGRGSVPEPWILATLFVKIILRS